MRIALFIFFLLTCAALNITNNSTKSNSAEVELINTIVGSVIGGVVGCIIIGCCFIRYCCK